MNFLILNNEYEYRNKPKDGFAYIYSLTDPETNHIRYIGYTKHNLLKRFRNHIYDVTIRNKVNHKSNWVRKLLNKDLMPIINIVDEVPFEEWQFWEMHYISLYKTWGFKLTNCTNGGDSSEGRKHSEETKRKISKSNTGKIKPNGACDSIIRSVTQFDLDGKFIKTYPSITSAGRETGISSKNINKSCQSKNHTAKGFSWCHSEYIVNRCIFLIQEKLNTNREKYVAKIDLSGNIIQIYKSQTEAAKDVGAPKSNISKVCITNKGTVKGFIWKHATKYDYDTYKKTKSF